MLEENVFGNPATLVKLPSGKRVALLANRRSSVQSHAGQLVGQIQCRVSADHGANWGPIYGVRDNTGTWDMGYQRAVVRDDGKVLVAYYFADRTYTDGPFHGEEALQTDPTRVVTLRLGGMGCMYPEIGAPTATTTTRTTTSRPTRSRPCKRSTNIASRISLIFSER